MIAAAAVLLGAALEHSMNEPFVAALDRALKGDAQVLQGLGIEEQIVTSPLWDDRVAVDGAGVVTFTSARASGDNGGTPIGVFRTKMEKAELLSLIRALRQIAAKPPPPSRSEAYETRILVSAVADGHTFGVGTSTAPQAMDLLMPVLAPLGGAIGKAMQHPVRSLVLTLEAPEGVARGGPTQFVLHLMNGGDEGYWVSNPAAVPNQPERERCELVYARPLVFTPGVTPVPVPPNRTQLVARKEQGDRPRFLWVPPKGNLPVPMQANVDPGDAKELVFRAELFGDQGDSIVAGQPRLKGSAFSADITVPIK